MHVSLYSYMYVYLAVIFIAVHVFITQYPIWAKGLEGRGEAFPQAVNEWEVRGDTDTDAEVKTDHKAFRVSTAIGHLSRKDVTSKKENSLAAELIY